VLEAIGATWDDLGDGVGSFPWRLEFVRSLLLESQDEVSFDEGPWAQPAAVIVAETLLVHRGSSCCYIPCFVECVDGIFECGRGFGFAVSDDSWSLVTYFGW